MADSRIEWCTKVWNPTLGCRAVSPGCANCYAEGMAARVEKMARARGQEKLMDLYSGLTKPGRAGRPQWTGVVRTVPDRLTAPMSWRKPTRVFVNSMSDLFHQAVPTEFIDKVFAVMALCPQHTFIVLTKRSRLMRHYLDSDPWDRVNAEAAVLEHWDNMTSSRIPLPNVWLGVSVENQSTAFERLEDLRETPAAVRIASFEPLLGPIDLRADAAAEWVECPRCGGDGSVAPYDGSPGGTACECVSEFDGAGTIPKGCFLDWAIVGGESGHGARPCHIEWVRSILRFCQEHGTPVFVKQLGAWRHPRPLEEFDTMKGERGRPPAFLVDEVGNVHCTRDAAGPGAVPMIRCGGKQSAMDELPEDLRIREFPR